MTAAKTPGRRRNNSQQMQANADQQFPTTEAEATRRRQEVNADANADDEDSNARIQDSRNPLQRQRDDLRRRLGHEAIRTDAEIPYSGEQGACASNKTPEQRRRRLGKEPVMEQELPASNATRTQKAQGGPGRAAPTPSTVQYPRQAPKTPRRMWGWTR